MRLRFIFLGLFCAINLLVSGQDTSATHVNTIRIHRTRQPLRSLVSYSNVLYTNVTNILTITYPDSILDCYDIEANLAFIKNLHRGKFIVVKHNPGILTISVYKKLLNGKRTLLTAQDFEVKPLPQGSITIGGNIIDSTVSLEDLLRYKKLDVVFGDFFPMDNICNVDTFDLRINNQQYQSTSNQLTDEMLNALKNSDGTIRFINVKVSLNAEQDAMREVDAKTKKVFLKHDEYLLEDTSKYIHLIR